MKLQFITTKDYYLLVDTETRTIGNIVYNSLNGMLAQIHFPQQEYDWKVVAHRPLNGAPKLEGVYELPVEDIHSLEQAQQFALGFFEETFTEHPKGGKITNDIMRSVINEAVKTGYKFGQKAASQKNYTAEDMRNLWNYVDERLNFMDDTQPQLGSFEQYIQSLTPQPIGFEPEWIEGEDYLAGMAGDNEIWATPATLKVINNVIQGRYIYVTE